MDLLFVLPIAIGLSMDAFAVSITQGIAISPVKARHVAKIALAFGIFQGLMPLLGWLAGIQLSEFVASVDHWIAFALLAFIGARMIREAFENTCGVESSRSDISWKMLLLLAVATSIDALAVGVTFALSGVNSFLDMAMSSLVICVVTAVISAVGVLIGKKVGCLFQRGAEIFGGCVLILLGMKILIEDLFF